MAAAVSWAHEGPRARAAQAPTGTSTLNETIVGDDPTRRFSLLRIGPGEPYVVRTDLGRGQAGRERRRFSVAYFGQLTDFQLADEESPARVEFSDPAGGPTTAAWRPQEALVPHMAEMSIRRMNQFLQSPVPQGNGTRAQLMNAVMTGDLADNAQRNETEWVRTLLEGGTLNPNTGSLNSADYSSCPPGTPGVQEAERYTGVQDYSDYFEHPHFYDPSKPIGVYGQRGWPTYPELMDRAQLPFQAQGLAVPTYVTTGNHDLLAQGNEDPVAAFEAVALGCVKPAFPPVTGATDLGSILNPSFLLSIASEPQKTMLVPPDPNRQYVDKAQFKQLFAGSGQADAHGFAYVDGAEQQASRGAAAYYSFSPRRGLRYLILDTLSEGGVTAQSSSGNVDDPQFRWLERELAAATRRDEMVVAFGHHATTSLTSNVPDEVAAPCTTNDRHNHDVNPGCDRDPRPSLPIHGTADITQLFNRFPHLVVYVAGHSHEARIAPKPDGRGSGFWEVKTPAIVDWPPQNRLVEVMDNRDGSLSIFGTLLDALAPAAAPSRTPDPGDLAGFTALGRTLSYNDPQVGPQGSPEGVRTDRNVELLLRDPRRNPLDPTGTRRCASVSGGIARSRLHRVSLGQSRRRVRRSYPRSSRRTRRDFDFFCLSDGRLVRVGFASPKMRIARHVRPRAFRRIRGKAMFVLTSSRRYRIRGVRPGSSVRTLRRRLRGERRHRIGKNVYFVASGRRTRLLFRTRGNRVHAIGIGSKRVTRGRRAERAYLLDFNN